MTNARCHPKYNGTKQKDFKDGPNPQASNEDLKLKTIKIRPGNEMASSYHDHSTLLNFPEKNNKIDLVCPPVFSLYTFVHVFWSH